MVELYTGNISAFKGFDWSGGNGEKNWERRRVTSQKAEQVLLAGYEPEINW